MDCRVWVVTGAARGLGAAIARGALDAGEAAVGVFRDKVAAKRFDKLSEQAMGVVFDVTRPVDVERGIGKAIARFGGVDVLVNNAGIGVFGAVEELDMGQYREQFEVNVFGVLNVTRAVLPAMRAKRSGTIFQMSSVSGFRALPGLGAYAASKFAMEGFSEALADEVRPLGIRVCILEPGPFRTDWIAGADAAQHVELADYAATAHRQIAALRAMDGKQPGDPAKAARLIVKLSRAAILPTRLPIGAVAIERVTEKLAAVGRDIEPWAAQSRATDYD